MQFQKGISTLASLSHRYVLRSIVNRHNRFFTQVCTAFPNASPRLKTLASGDKELEQYLKRSYSSNTIGFTDLSGTNSLDTRADTRSHSLERNLEEEIGLYEEDLRRQDPVLLSDPKVTVIGKDIPNPSYSFEGTIFDASILNEMQKKGLTKPTTIQAYCLPVALSGRDMVGIGQTGSGKTLAYLLPALVHIFKQPQVERGQGPIALIMAPTRELAQQIQTVVHMFNKISHPVRSACVYGGSSKNVQIQTLRGGVHICVATPGRLLDLIEMGCVNLSQCSYLVLDEADRMLDMGFEPQIRDVIRHLSPHQTLMWSATWPEDVRTLACDFMTNFVQINVGSTDLYANPNIKQTVEVCSEQEKEGKLFQLIQEILKTRENKVLIFAQTKSTVDEITRELTYKRFPVTSIHGNKSQEQRDIALKDFRNNRKQILVATDVAARGLDVSDITHIINYDYPNTTETYVHRIGRTARGTMTGFAHSFFTRTNAVEARDLIAILEQSNQHVSPELIEMANSTRGSRKSERSMFAQKSSFYNKGGFSQQRNKFNGERNTFRRAGFNKQNNYLERDEEDNFESERNYPQRNYSQRNNFNKQRNFVERDEDSFEGEDDFESERTYSQRNNPQRNNFKRERFGNQRDNVKRFDYD